MTGGVVGGGDEQQVRPVAVDRRQRGVDVDRQILAPRHGDPLGIGAGREDGVHRVAGHEPHGRPPGTTERLQQLLKDLVGAVGGPHHVDVHGDTGLTGEVRGQVGAQSDGVAVGVAVEVRRGGGHGCGDVGDQRGAGRVRVLVGVELDGDLELGRAVRALATEVVPERQGVEADTGAGAGGHRSSRPAARSSKRARTASPWAGSRSASASATTVGAISLRAAWS